MNWKKIQLPYTTGQYLQLSKYFRATVVWEAFTKKDEETPWRATLNTHVLGRFKTENEAKAECEKQIRITINKINETILNEVYLK